MGALIPAWGHDALAEDLANRLQEASDRMIWTDMQLGPSGSPRPDVFTLNKSFTKPMPLAYECKISVSDFRRDITAGKWQSYLRYASGVIFAVPAGLIDKADVPKGCGLMVRGAAGWKTVKGPTMSVPDMPRDFWMKLLIDGLQRLRREHKPRSASAWLIQDKLRDKLGDRVARAVADTERFLFDAAEEKRLRDEGVKRIDQELSDIRQYRLASMMREAAQVNAAGQQLLNLLGLPQETSSHAVAQQAKKLLARLDRDEELSRLRSALRFAKNALENIDDIPKIVEPGSLAAAE